MNKILNDIEKRTYDESCSPKDLEILKSRVFIYEPGIVYFKEIPIQSPFSINLHLNLVEELGKQFDKWAFLVDLREAQRPNAATRRLLIQKFEKTASNAVHVSFYTKGILLHTAIRFVMFGLDTKSYSVNDTFEDALTAAQASLK